jgi:(E)-4-hydroxy-3-methylbut-2-enyl-diphosphate synthase
MRIGTNHGSLSDRIMNRYGDSPAGMVESALEFLRIARKLGYHDIILSMKSSNPKVMVQAYRQLAAAMDAEGMDYPLHLGVTEAGDGEDGRIKSMAGIATLLEDGLGDTVRVSLTEDPEFEMPVAYRIANRYPAQPAGSVVTRGQAQGALADAWVAGHPLDLYQRRQSAPCKLGSLSLDGKSVVRVLTPAPHPAAQDQANLAWVRAYKRGPNEFMIRPEVLVMDVEDAQGMAGLNRFVPGAWERKMPTVARLDLGHAAELVLGCQAHMLALRIPTGAPGPATQERLARALAGAKAQGQSVLLELVAAPWEDLLASLEPALAAAEAAGVADVALCIRGFQPSPLIHLNRALVAWEALRPRQHPLVLALESIEAADEMQLSASTAFGALLLDGVGDALLAQGEAEGLDTVGLSFNILQAAGVRISKTEFISCPSCGRTLFDLQEVTARIKARTGHLVGVKVAIMGCIVNGPGEMADADFGYVGGAPGLINLYVGKDCVEKGIPMAGADDRLVELIKQNGKWMEPGVAAAKA